jgi:hypothetical protein
VAKAVATEAPTEAAERVAPSVLRGTEVLSPEELDAGPYLPVTDMQVLVSSSSVERVKELSGVPITGVLFDDGEYLMGIHPGAHPMAALDEQGDRFVESLAAGQVSMARAVYPHGRFPSAARVEVLGRQVEDEVQFLARRRHLRSAIACFSRALTLNPDDPSLTDWTPGNNWIALIISTSPIKAGILVIVLICNLSIPISVLLMFWSFFSAVKYTSSIIFSVGAI